MTHWQHQKNPTEIVTALEAAWPGVRVKMFDIVLDKRAPGDICGEEYADTLNILATISGTAEALLAAGLIAGADIPAAGQKRYRWHSVTATARGVRLNVAISDRRNEDTRLERIIDSMALALFSSIWQPPRTARSDAA